MNKLDTLIQDIVDDIDIICKLDHNSDIYYYTILYGGDKIYEFYIDNNDNEKNIKDIINFLSIAVTPLAKKDKAGRYITVPLVIALEVFKQKLNNKES